MSADVDAAREALYAEADDYEHRVRVEAFEAAIRAEGLDVERLQEAAVRHGVNRSDYVWGVIAAEYARLAGADDE